MLDSLNIVIGLIGYFLILLDISGVLRWLGQSLKNYRIRLFRNARRVVRPNHHRTTIGNYRTLMISAPFLLLALLVWISTDVYRFETVVSPSLVPYLEYAFLAPIGLLLVIWLMFWVRLVCARFFKQWNDRSRRHPLQWVLVVPVAALLLLAMVVIGTYTGIILVIGVVIWAIHIALNFPRRGVLATIGIAAGTIALLLELQYQYL